MKNYSVSEENYLKWIFILSSSLTSSANKHDDKPATPLNAKTPATNLDKKQSADEKKQYQNVIEKLPSVSTSALAKKLGLRSASITNMLKKLHTNGLIKYTRYQGVSLLPAGYEIAVRILRKHRLWETFLYEKLHFEWGEVHEIAEQLEHIDSIALVDRLDAFLDFPRFDPHGDPIPDSVGRIFPRANTIILSKLEKNQSGVLTRILENSAELISYLNEITLHIDCSIEMLDFNSFDKAYKIKIFPSRSPRIAKRIKTSPIQDSASQQKKSHRVDGKVVFLSKKIADLLLISK